MGAKREKSEEEKESGSAIFFFFLLVTNLGLGIFVLKEIKTMKLYYVMSVFHKEVAVLLLPLSPRDFSWARTATNVV